MTKKSLTRVFVIASAIFMALLITGVVISTFDTTDDRIIFTTFKDLIPLFLGIAAVWLGYFVQRRSAYQQQLRALWTSLVEAVNLAVQYTYLRRPTEEQYRSVLTRLGIAIDEVRGVFCNLNESVKDIGLYPFEPIKDIYALITDLGYTKNFKAASAQRCRDRIFVLWKEMRKEILKEFDREEPTFSHSHWADLEKARVYDDHRIPKKAT